MQCNFLSQIVTKTCILSMFHDTIKNGQNNGTLSKEAVQLQDTRHKYGTKFHECDSQHARALKMDLVKADITIRLSILQLIKMTTS